MKSGSNQFISGLEERNNLFQVERVSVPPHRGSQRRRGGKCEKERKNFSSLQLRSIPHSRRWKKTLNRGGKGAKETFSPWVKKHIGGGGKPARKNKNHGLGKSIVSHEQLGGRATAKVWGGEIRRSSRRRTLGEGK